MRSPTDPKPGGIPPEHAALREELVRFAQTWLRDRRAEADDFVNVTLMKLLMGPNAEAAPRHLRALAYTTLKRLMIDAWRRDKRRGVHVSIDGADPEDSSPKRAPDLVARSGYWETDLEVQRLLAEIPEPQRTFYVLLTFEEQTPTGEKMTPERAAQLCGWPERSFAYRYRQINERVAELMGVPPKPKKSQKEGQ